MNKTTEQSTLTKIYRGKDVLITGGLGMLGSNIANELVGFGANVKIVDAHIKPYGANLFNIEKIKKKVQLSVTDIRDRESMKFLVQGQDIIFNLAGQVSHNDSIDNPFLDAEINYLGHLNVVESVRKYNPGAVILFAGSRLQFGKTEKIPVNENHPLRPKTPYAFNKTVAENMYRYYYEIHGIRSVGFRVANPYGIRCQMTHAKYSIINYFLRLAMEDRTITIYGDGEQMRDYIYIDDLANAFILAAVNEDAAGEVFNIGSGEGTKFREMAKTIIDVVGTGEIEYVPWPESYLNVETGDYVTDITKAKACLHWEPAARLQDGIRKTYAYYLKNWEHYVS